MTSSLACLAIQALPADATARTAQQPKIGTQYLLGPRQRVGILRGIGLCAHARANRSRIEHIDAHQAGAAELIGQGAAERFDAELRDRIGAPIGLGPAADAAASAIHRRRL